MLAYWYTKRFTKALLQPAVTTYELQSLVFQEYLKTWAAVYRP